MFFKRRVCKRAVAYLKPKLSGPASGPEMVLSEEDSPVMRDLDNGLLVTYLVDRGAAYQYIQHRDLQRERVAENELHEFGLANLRKIAKRSLEIHRGRGIFIALMGGDFESSLLLLDELWDITLREAVAGDYVVAIPYRDILAVSGASSSEGIAELHALLERVPDGDHPVTRDLYTRVDGKWVVWKANDSR